MTQNTVCFAVLTISDTVHLSGVGFNCQFREAISL